MKIITAVKNDEKNNKSDNWWKSKVIKIVITVISDKNSNNGGKWWKW